MIEYLQSPQLSQSLQSPQSSNEVVESSTIETIDSTNEVTEGKEIIIFPQFFQSSQSPQSSNEVVGSSNIEIIDLTYESNDNEYFEVEEIIEAFRINNEIFYKIKWTGYAEETWEPEENLTDCRDKIEEFLKNNHTIEELAGADPTFDEFNPSIWVSVEKVIERINAYNKMLHINTTLKIKRFKKLGKQNALYIMINHGHLFVFLHLNKDKIIYLTDGNNTYLNNQKVKEVMKPAINLTKNSKY